MPIGRHLVARGGLAALAAVAGGGCGTGDDRTQPRAVVERFYDAVRDDRGDDACDALSSAAVSQLESQSGQSCATVITRLDYDGGAVVAAHVYVTAAKVDLRNGESAFLDHGSTGWKLTAIGCRPESGPPRDVPYECELEA